MDTMVKNMILEHRSKTCTMNGWYDVTPELANYLLGLNVSNYRNLNSNRVNMYASDMVNGKWQKNGEPVVIGKNGILQNGQHRLHGVVKSGTTIQMYLIFDADVTVVYDGGAQRTLSSWFKYEQLSVSTFNVATAKLLVKYGLNDESMGNVFIRDYILENYEYLKKAESIVTTSGTTGRKAACAAVVYSLLKNGEISEADMRSFFRIMNSGNNFGCAKEASSAFVLRKQISEMRGGGRAIQASQIEITYKALRDFKFGNKRKLRYNNDTTDAERLIKDAYTTYNMKNQNIA